MDKLPSYQLRKKFEVHISLLKSFMSKNDILSLQVFYTVFLNQIILPGYVTKLTVVLLEVNFEIFEIFGTPWDLLRPLEGQ